MLVHILVLQRSCIEPQYLCYLLLSCTCPFALCMGCCMCIISLPYLWIYLNCQFLCPKKSILNILMDISCHCFQYLFYAHMFFLFSYFLFLAVQLFTSLTLWKFKILELTSLSISCWQYCVFHVLVCLMNCSTLFSVHFSCHMPACTSTYSLKIISLSTPLAVSPHMPDICMVHT